MLKKFVSGFSAESVASMVLNQDPVDNEKGKQFTLETLDF